MPAKLLLFPLMVLMSYAPAEVPAPAIQLPGYFACTQSMLVPGQDVLACYAPTQRECQNGRVVLAYQKRLTKTQEEPRYQIADTLQLNVSAATNYLTIATCATTRGQSTQYFVLCKRAALGAKYLRSILRVWGVSAQGKLVEVPAKTVRCLNDDFGA